MSKLAVVLAGPAGSNPLTCLDALTNLAPVTATAAVLPPGVEVKGDPHAVLRAPGPHGSEAVAAVLAWLADQDASHLLWILDGRVELPRTGLKRLLGCAAQTGAALAYGDYSQPGLDGQGAPRPLTDYQLGSLRDDFAFGPLMMIDRERLMGLEGVLRVKARDLAFGGLYDLRLRLAETGPVIHLPEPISALPAEDRQKSGERVFDYVDPKNRDYQVEMEWVATAHLKRIGAWLPPAGGEPVAGEGNFPVTASVIIPVRNREKTIAQAAESALSQQAAFDFNVIVVDNHSTDGTSRILEDLASKDPRLVHRVPTRTDLGIGGCWNEAVFSAACGRYAVQLDSDDLYSGPDVLARIVAAFTRQPVAMVIGAYTIVDFDLNQIPPGLIDHREWTAGNGHNNALRIHGLGAPRAFHVPTLRTIGFPNVSYGEDYAVALRLCRSYRVGRILDSLYWCRRWEDNTDAGLALDVENRYHAYKDRLRSLEIMARKRLRAEGP